MKIKLNVNITDLETNIEFEDKEGNVKILDINDLELNTSNKTLYILLKDKNIKYITKTLEEITDKKLDKLIAITVPNDINLEYLEYSFLQDTKENKVKLINKPIIKEPKIEEKQIKDTIEYKNKVLFVLEKFGYELFKVKENNEETKTTSVKARHRWTKEISKIIFTAKSKGGEGKAIWQSRDKLILLSGAKLVEDPQLNKDGTINYSAQFAEKVRTDHADKIVKYVTTEDIIFPSPNILGIFLFYGGQNTWLELIDDNGKTLDEWSRVE